jgi:hypothetical protein
VRLENPQPTTFGLGIQASDGLAEGQSFVSIKPKPLSYDRRPECQDWCSIDSDCAMGHRFAVVKNLRGRHSYFTARKASLKRPDSGLIDGDPAETRFEPIGAAFGGNNHYQGALFQAARITSW